MFDAYPHESEFALRAVRTGALLCRQIQSEIVTNSMAKSDRSPVTVADFACQAVIARMLQETFPADELVAEEDSTGLRSSEQAQTLATVTSFVSNFHPGASTESVCRWIDYGAGEPKGRFWVLDPIDGTKGFLRGDQYVVALALVESGQVMLGALGCPNLGPEITPDVGGLGSAVIAVRGNGTWGMGLEGDSLTRLKVSDQKTPSLARILRSFETEHTDVLTLNRLTEDLGTTYPPVLMDSLAKFAILASGGGDLLFRLLSPSKPDYVESIWDQAAGAIIVEEAEGMVSDLRGETLNFNRGRKLIDNVGVLVSNGWLHEAALTALRGVGADQRPGVA